MPIHMLHLLRHAKSSWKGDVEDHERRLNKSGRAAARLVGEHLPAAVGALDLVLCSSAARTRETLELAIARFAQHPRCSIEEGLYLADCGKLLTRLRRLDESCLNVLVIGHNPGLQELAALLADHDASMPAMGKFPTAARASFRSEAAWAALGTARHSLIAYVTPASLPGGKR